MTDNCNQCRQLDYRNANLTEMLSWFLKRLEKENVAGRNMSDILRENCVLDSWWKNNQRAYEIKLQREKEEKDKQQKIEVALKKLTDEEKELLNIRKIWNY